MATGWVRGFKPALTGKTPETSVRMAEGWGFKPALTGKTVVPYSRR